MSDDVAKPTLYWVNDRCYRRNPAKNNYGIQHAGLSTTATGGGVSCRAQSSATMLPYTEFDDMAGCDPDGIDEDHEAQYVIEEVAGGFRTRCEIPETLYAVIIGAKGSVKKRVEVESNIKLLIPRIGEKGDVWIRGSNRENVGRARHKIELIASQGRFRREATHFLCFPLKSQNIIQSVQQFQDKVTSDFKSQGLGIDEKLFQEAGKIHLTLCVLIVLDQIERKSVADTLEHLKPEITKLCSNRPLRLRLQGLEIMNDDPTQVNILFAKCSFTDKDSPVQAVADFIYQTFLKTGYTKPSRSESVKLHATLMNTRYRHEETNGSDGGNRGSRFDNKTENFNAKPILDKYGDYDFGFVEIKEVHISTRHTKGPDGFYKPSAKLSLND